jgi:hypothetical protein
MVELARIRLKSLPVGRSIGSDHCQSARFDSLALVFFAQATLDQIAVWLKRELKLKLNGKHTQLDKSEFLSSLAGSGQLGRDVADRIRPNHDFLKELQKFRQIWIHSLAGGAAPFTDKAPDQGGVPEIKVPIDPDVCTGPHNGFVDRVESCRDQHGGRWLYPISEFADRFSNGAKSVSLSILDSATRLLP